jgi:alkylation response protein AidB-like acyl-CoA dehydrogenase
MEWRALLAESIIFAVHACKQAVDLVFEAAGAGGVYRGEPLERCFRDMHTAAQHIIIHESRYEVIGQYHLTKDQPGGPMIAGMFPL